MLQMLFGYRHFAHRKCPTSLTAWKLQNIFSLLNELYSFWLHCIMVGVLHYVIWLEDEAELRYQYRFGKKNCLTVMGERLFATPGALTFFF